MAWACRNPLKGAKSHSPDRIELQTQARKRSVNSGKRVDFLFLVSCHPAWSCFVRGFQLVRAGLDWGKPAGTCWRRLRLLSRPVLARLQWPWWSWRGRQGRHRQGTGDKCPWYADRVGSSGRGQANVGVGCYSVRYVGEVSQSPMRLWTLQLGAEPLSETTTNTVDRPGPDAA